MKGRILDLRKFKIPLGKLAPLETFKTRQGATLSYRLYPAWCEDLIVLYHGVGSDSRYMCVLASALAQAGVANVVTPDFRGHGASLGVSDIIPENQLEIDLEELLIHVKMQRAISRITLAGHSLGGGFTLRVATSELHKQFAKFVALAPRLPAHLQAFYPNYGGWISPNEDGSFAVNMPEALRSGQEKITYSKEFLKAASPPDDVMEKLLKLSPPLKVFTGADDEVDIPERHLELFTKANIPVEIVPGLNHLSIVSKPDSYLSRF
ncbi:lysophospholipase [Bdellovibrio bacteriovorus]|uniref:Lysophospholipase n=1 Tax=Bdellovibrio bacteriovorus TaxID=959 RepID=A0A150WUB3_BDEBC|nr:alpha/beta fold hydrolase [Bdellovibrio bacteriovorus]KYG69986.1 lysophospholipase [Bdellovibrio bacteriovorus]